jgi:hypothetical protein
MSQRPFRRFRTSRENIQFGVRMYFRFPLSLRDFEDADVHCHAFGEYEVGRSSPRDIRLYTAISISKGISTLDQASKLIGTPGFANEATFALLGARSREFRLQVRIRLTAPRSLP